jgi:hypothetical protein
LAMVGAGAAEEGAVDIEEDEGGGEWHGWQFMMAERGGDAQARCYNSSQWASLEGCRR